MPGVVYQFSWRPNIWSEFYPAAPETLEYLQDVARENDFYRLMRFNQEIIGASWEDNESKWTLRVRNHETKMEFEDKVDVFLEFNGPIK